jgi:hypothetical protein
MPLVKTPRYGRQETTAHEQARTAGLVFASRGIEKTSVEPGGPLVHACLRVHTARLRRRRRGFR